MEKLLIVGGGMAAGSLISNLVKNGYQGKVTLLSEEAYLPYQRPPLSKSYITDEKRPENILIKKESFYEDNNVTVQLETVVTSIDPIRAEVDTNRGQTFQYDKLVIATGSTLRKLSVDGCDMPGVCYLRGASCADAIKERLLKARDVVIIGGGFIGLEFAGTAIKNGSNVTVIDSGERLLSRVISDEIASYIQKEFERQGVTFLLSNTIKSFGGQRRVEYISCEPGGEVKADLVVVGIGAEPADQLAASAKIRCQNGIVVDSYCETSQPNIYALGDCVSQFNIPSQKWMRLESVHNALEQAKTVSSVLCGKPAAQQTNPWFWSDQLDMKIKIVGASTSFKQFYLHGAADGSGFSHVYIDEGKIVSVHCVNDQKTFLKARKLLELGPVSEERLKELIEG